MTQSGFQKFKFAGSLPTVIVCRRDFSPVLAGGAVEFDTSQSIDDDRFLMQQVFYTTPDRIHGVLHYAGPNQLFFIGYKCGLCSKVYLLPDSVKDETSVHQALRH